MTTHTQQLLMADLVATFPGFWMRPLGEFGEQWSDTAGIWTGAADTCMPDGQPIFDVGCPDQDQYDGGVHHGFIAWLEARHWSIERYDDTTFFLVPFSYFYPASSIEVRQ